MLPTLWPLHAETCADAHTHTCTHQRGKTAYKRSVKVILEGKESNYGSMYSEPVQLR